MALIDDEEATLKRLRRKGASIALEAANPAYETRIFGPDRVRIQGRLTGLLRKVLTFSGALPPPAMAAERRSAPFHDEAQRGALPFDADRMRAETRERRRVDYEAARQSAGARSAVTTISRGRNPPRRPPGRERG